MQPGFAIAVSLISRRRRPSVLHAEAVADVVAFLDRLSIERILMVGRQFTQAADHLLTSGNVPLRFFDIAGICFRRNGTLFFLAKHPQGGSGAFEDPDVWAYVVRWSAVTETEICAFSCETPVEPSSMWDRFMGCMKMMASAEAVLFRNVNLCPVSNGELKQLATFDFLRKIDFDHCLMLSASIDNEFLRLISADRAQNLTLSLENSVPCDRATFTVDDDGILQFLCSGEGRYARTLDAMQTRPNSFLCAWNRDSPQFKASRKSCWPSSLGIRATSSSSKRPTAFRRDVNGPPDQAPYVHDDSRLTPSLLALMCP